jgi:hypothetical protein
VCLLLPHPRLQCRRAERQPQPFELLLPVLVVEAVQAIDDAVAHRMYGGFVGGPRGHEPGQRGRVLRPEDDLLFGRKVAEQRAGGHVGRRGDLLDRRGLDALIGEQPQRLRLDGAAGPLLLPFPQRRGRLIARQRPLWQPGTRQGYHYVTSGWIAAELIRRTDPARRTLGRFFRDEVAVPLGLDFHIGLPPDLPDERVARIKAFHGTQLLLHPTTMPPGMLLAFINPWSLTARTFLNPRMASPTASSCARWRSRPPAGSAAHGRSPAASGSWPPAPRPCASVAARWTS